MELLCLAVAAVALLVTWGLTPLVRALCLRLGFVDRPGERKIHAHPVAYGGGLAVAAGAAAAVALGYGLWHGLLQRADWSAWRSGLGLEAYAEQVRLAATPSLARVLLFCCGGAAGALLWGLADDRWTFEPWTKLAGQFVLAVVVVGAGGVRVTALIGDGPLMQTVTVLWIVLLTNSFNLLDNMDGLCAGTAAIASAVLALVASAAGQAQVALGLSALSGACVGFLRWNSHPASIFLGDAGSMCIGFLLACLSVVTTYYHYHESVLSIGVPLLVLAIPLYDTASVMLIRLRQGRKLMRGDNSHFSHRLVDLGMSQRQAVDTIHLAALAIALPAAVITSLTTAEGLLLVGQAVLVLTLIAVLEHAGAQRRKRQEERTGDE